MGLLQGARWGMGGPTTTTDLGGTSNVAPGTLNLNVGGSYSVGGQTHVQFAAGWLIAIGALLVVYTIWVR